VTEHADGRHRALANTIGLDPGSSRLAATDNHGNMSSDSRMCNGIWEFPCSRSFGCGIGNSTSTRALPSVLAGPATASPRRKQCRPMPLIVSFTCTGSCSFCPADRSVISRSSEHIRMTEMLINPIKFLQSRTCKCLAVCRYSF